MTTRYAAAYLRRSVVTKDNPGEGSEAAQTKAVTDMCGPNVVIYGGSNTPDWGMSGTKANRPEYQRLRADIRAGKVESVCAYSLSRLGRSTKELIDFMELCRAHNVDLRTKVENIDTSNAMGKLVYTFMAAIATFEADVARERSAAGIEAQKAKGHDMTKAKVGFRADKDANGKRILVKDGTADLIIEAYKATRTIEGAAEKLTADGVLTPWEASRKRGAEKRGETYTPSGKVWASSVVRRALETHAPQLLPPKRPSNRQRRGSGLWGQLVMCPECSRVLTPNLPRNLLYCSAARLTPGHSHKTASLHTLRPWVEAQATLYKPEGVALMASTTQPQRDALTARKLRLGQAFADGAVTPEAYALQRDAIDAELAAIIDGDRALLSITPNPVGVDFATQTDEEVGDIVRTIWERIELHKDRTPKRVVWRIPEYLYDPKARAERIAEYDAAVVAAQKAGA